MVLSKICVMLCVVLVIGAMTVADAQSTTDCAQDLVPCAAYLNSTNPPSSCCTPLKEAVSKKLQCLCGLFNTPGLLQSFNVNITQALELSRRCGITQGIENCKASKAPSPSVPPPATPGHDNGDASRVAFTGLSFLVLFWASMLFN